jgi:hypothetical protein
LVWLDASGRAGTVSIAANVNFPATLADSVSSAGTANRMAGMRVTVNFVGGGSSTASWISSGTTSGQASNTIGNGTWTLAVTGDPGAVFNSGNPDGTAVNGWTLTSTATSVAIASVSLDGGPGNVVFDRDNFTNGQVGTPNSALGIDYTFFTESGVNSPFGVTVTYSRIVQFTGPSQPAQGAFYAGLSFSFTSGGPFEATPGVNAVWRFYQDVDFVVSALKITSITRSGNGVLLECRGAPSAVNRVEASNDLSPNSFSTLGSPTADDSGAFPFTDPNPGNLPKRFYRVAYP